MSNRFAIEARDVPAIRIADAVGRKVNRNIMFVVNGGLGDRICAEPTLRFALETFTDCKYSLYCDTPEIFRHLSFEKVYGRDDKVPPGTYLQIPTYPLPFMNQFFSPNLMHGVDCASITALRCQLPRRYRQPMLAVGAPPRPEIQKELSSVGKYGVVVHLGKTWPSRTLPINWWQDVMRGLVRLGFVPVVVGHNCKELDLGVGAAIDLRERLSLDEFLFTCKYSTRIVTNDSSPFHVASTGGAMIALVATSRNPDYLVHQRMTGETAVFYGKPMWPLFHRLPNTLEDHPANEVPEGHRMEEFLPDPYEVVRWITK